jgi:signal peptidase I
MARSRNPLAVYLEGFDWSGRTGRGRFLFALLVVALPLAVLWQLDLTRGQIVWMHIWLAVMWIPFWGHVLRRLNDLGWTGWLGWFLILPFVNAALIAVMLLIRPQMRQRVSLSRWRSLGFGLVAASVPVVALGAFVDLNRVGSLGMKPTLLPGDVVIATTPARLAARRGDVVFVAGGGVGRVIGLAGDHVAIADGVVMVNGSPLAQSDKEFFDEIMGPQGPEGDLPRCLNGAVGQGALCRKRLLVEALPDGAVHPVLNAGDSALDHFEDMTVPAGQLFLLGDNRDNAADSRIARAAGGLGLVDEATVLSRARLVGLSATGRSLWQVWTWRKGRILEAVR